MEVNVAAGDDFSLRIFILEAYDANGQPLASIQGLSWRLQGRATPGAKHALFTKSSAGGQIVPDTMSVWVRFVGADTAKLGGMKIYCDLEARDAQNRKATVFFGNQPYIILNVWQDVTRE